MQLRAHNHLEHYPIYRFFCFLGGGESTLIQDGGRLKWLA